MKVSYNWLREFVDIKTAPSAVRERLTLGGLEIEGEAHLGADIRAVVVAEIVSIVPHPQTDRLSLCAVRGASQPVSVVCGATNMKAGDRVAMHRRDDAAGWTTDRAARRARGRIRGHAVLGSRAWRV
jgi:phenylalanyl-tRNA synthetase beta chain